MNDLMTKFLGDNWRTSFWGAISAIGAFIAFYPDALSPFPDYWENLFRQISAFVLTGGLLGMGMSGRDKKASKNEQAVVQEQIEDIEKVSEKAALNTRVVAKEVLELKRGTGDGTIK